MGKRPIGKYLDETPGGEIALFAVSAEKGLPLSPQMKERVAKVRRPIAPETAREALNRILLSLHPGVIRDLCEVGVLRTILPELQAVYALEQNNPHHIYTVGEHILRTVEGVPPTVILRWAALLHDVGKSRTHTVDMYGVDHFHGHEEVSARIAETVLSRLSFPEQEKEAVVRLVRFHDLRPHISEAEAVFHEMGKEEIERLLILQEADARAQNPEKLPPKLKYLTELRARILPKSE